MQCLRIQKQSSKLELRKRTSKVQRQQHEKDIIFLAVVPLIFAESLLPGNDLRTLFQLRIQGQLRKDWLCLFYCISWTESKHESLTKKKKKRESLRNNTMTKIDRPRHALPKHHETLKLIMARPTYFLITRTPLKWELSSWWFRIRPILMTEYKNLYAWRDALITTKFSCYMYNLSMINNQQNMFSQLFLMTGVKATKLKAKSLSSTWSECIRTLL